MHRLCTAALSAFVLFVTLGTTACAPARQQWSSRPPVSADVITASEIGRASPKNAYSALEELRPLFLRTRPNAASDARGEAPRINVFIDGSFSGELDVLKLIPASDIESITRVQPEMAFTTMGDIRAGDGVLMVRLRCHGVC
jgi:hypothetical protein